MSSKKIDAYYELLKKWNNKFNLVSIKDRREFEVKHLEDAKRLLPFLASSNRLLDLGTGAGLPGLLIKILKKDLDIVLLDSRRKRVAFCQEAIRQLGLTSIRAEWGQAEDVNCANNLGKFDIIVTRATWNLAKYLEIARLYININGKIIAMKGAEWRTEMHLVDDHPLFSLCHHDEYEIEGGGKRCILVFQPLPKNR